MALEIVLTKEYENDPIMDHYRNHRNSNQYDAGIDVIMPSDMELTVGFHLLKFGIKCRHGKQLDLVPRSSIAKSQLRMKSIITLESKNQFSKELFATVYCKSDCFVSKGTRLFQLVNYDLTPMTVHVTPHSESVLTLNLKTINPHLSTYYKTFEGTNQTNSIDVILPNNIVLKNGTNVIKLGIACEPLEKCGYMLCQHPHEKFNMCNVIGIIDYGYRGEIMAKVDYSSTDNDPMTLEAGSKLFYLTNKAYEKLQIMVVNDLTTTDRGAGGFGSTGVGITSSATINS